jgi:hypothetical protein
LLECVRTLETRRHVAESRDFNREIKEAERAGDHTRARELAQLQVQARRKAMEDNPR